MARLDVRLARRALAAAVTRPGLLGWPLLGAAFASFAALWGFAGPADTGHDPLDGLWIALAFFFHELFIALMVGWVAGVAVRSRLRRLARVFRPRHLMLQDWRAKGIVPAAPFAAVDRVWRPLLQDTWEPMQQRHAGNVLLAVGVVGTLQAVAWSIAFLVSWVAPGGLGPPHPSGGSVWLVNLALLAWAGLQVGLAAMSLPLAIAGWSAWRRGHRDMENGLREADQILQDNLMALPAAATLHSDAPAQVAAPARRRRASV